MNIQKILNQIAVYWQLDGLDGYGNDTYLDPVEVAVRWTDGQEKFIGNNAEEHTSSAYILAETDFEINGRMFLGTLTDLSSSQEPNDNSALTIKGFSKIPTKRADQFLRKAWLV